MARFSPIAALVCASLCLWFCCNSKLRAHEVDQYDFPPGQELVDQAAYWDDLLLTALQRAVAKTNRELDEIKHVLPGLRHAREAQLRSPAALTKRVRGAIPCGLITIDKLEYKLHYFSPRPENANQVQAHFSSRWNGTFGLSPYWTDPRIWNCLGLLRCSAIKVHGHYIGTDKVGHFVGIGGVYYTYYQCARSAGQSQADAAATALNCHRYGPTSENGVWGCVSTGVYSNADMAANYAGLKFYMNVTEPVAIGGQERPPMVVFDGEYWRIQPHVKPDYFAIFLSRHWDEVLNPSVYEWTFRHNIRQRIEQRRDAILTRYAGDDPAKRTPEYFDAVLADCLTWYGEEYGHCRQLDKLIPLSKVCFDEPVSADPAARTAGLLAALADPRKQADGAPIAAHCERLPALAVERVSYAEALPPKPLPQPRETGPAYQAIREGRQGTQR